MTTSTLPITGQPIRRINLREALAMPFRDPRWQPKFGLLVLCGCIPGLNLIAWVGYQQSIAVSRAHGITALPSWDDWADILVRGLTGVTASGLYFLPAAILLALGSRSLIILGGGLLCVILGSLVLYAAHLRVAQTDQPGEYGIDGWRDRLRLHQWRTVPTGIFIGGWLLQLLTLLVAIILTPITLITIIGVVIVWSALSVINGSLIGQAAANLTP